MMDHPVVLIVDDNDDNRFTLSMRLESRERPRGAREDAGGPGRSRSLDIIMAETNGYEVLEHFESQLRAPRPAGYRDLRAGPDGQRHQVHRARR